MQTNLAIVFLTLCSLFMCFRSDSLEEVELSKIPEERLVRVDLVPKSSKSVRRPSPELDSVPSEVTRVDQDQVEGEIPAGFGMYDHR